VAPAGLIPAAPTPESPSAPQPDVDLALDERDVPRAILEDPPPIALRQTPPLRGHGDRDEPRAGRLRAAVGVNDRLGAVPRAATARWRLAQALARRGAPGDARRADGLLAAAAAAAEALGMRAFAGEIGLTRAATA
jgi:hypothetical protein